MTPRLRRLLLGITAAMMLAFLIAWLANPAVARDVNRPQELDQLAAYLADHPADWLAASAISDQALDSTLPRRHELWRAAYAHAARLAPRRPNAAAAFARAGLFHWYELGPADRARVLETTAPLLGDPMNFARMHRPLWELTGDFAYLRKHAPRDERALHALRELAAMHGRFGEYRELRAELTETRFAKFNAERSTRSPAELMSLVPQRPTKADETLIRGVIEELRRRPLAAERESIPRGKVHELIAFALRHGIGIDGLEALTGDDLPMPRADVPGKWEGLCSGEEICRFASATLTGPAAITIQNAQSDEVAPYVEIYVDDALVAEGEVVDSRRFEVLRGTTPHRVEVRLVNPWTRNRIQRRVRLS